MLRPNYPYPSNINRFIYFFIINIYIYIFFSGMHTIAAQLLGSGAAINDTMSDGQTLLHMAIKRQDSKSALFLLEHQADINVR